MSRTISLYSSVVVKPEEFLRFVADLGGHISDQEEISGGVSSGSCHVWFYYVRQQLAGGFEEPEEGVVERLGSRVMARVNLHLSHEDGSGPLALRFAHHFARRWPAVATLAAYRFFTAIDAEQFLNSPGIPAMLGASLRVLSTEAPDPDAAISALEGVVIDSSDPTWLNCARAEIGAIEGPLYDPGAEEIIGVVPAGLAHIWILRQALALPGESADIDFGERLISIATGLLGARPSWMIRALVGYGAPPENKRVALSFCERLLQGRSGVGMGIFYQILDVEGLGRMLESDDDTLGTIVA